MAQAIARKGKLIWYLNRLRTMNIGEVGYRLKKHTIKNIDRINKTGRFPQPIDTSYPDPILSIPEDLGSFPTDSFKIFTAEIALNEPIDWHQDIITGKRAPLKYSHSINTRTEEHGIVKVIWEINRLQFLTNLCLQFRHSRDVRYIEQFISIIKSWKESNPYLVGVNWYSNIEVNLRIITWFLCWEILEINALVQSNQTLREFTDEVWLPLIRLHAQHSERYISDYSSANNHRIAEGTGLFIAGIYWNFPESENWTDRGRNILEEEMINQHSPTGINREQASEYIQFITDFFLIAQVVADARNQPFSRNYLRSLKNIMLYIFHLMDQTGNVPYYGDDDDGHTFILANEKSPNNFQSLVMSGAILFSDNEFKSRGGAHIDIKNKILFGKTGVLRYKSLATPPPNSVSKYYPQDGHFFIKGSSNKKEVYIHIDAAPLGYLSIAAHGHADALSFILHLDGVPYLSDMGTYTYHSEPQWRAYFKGTLAHNTIRVDYQDQADNGGPCLWLNHYQTTVEDCRDTETETVISASHNGYQNLGVIHHRTYKFEKNLNRLEIIDKIISTDDSLHVYEIPFHLNPRIKAIPQTKNTYALSCMGHQEIRINLDPKTKPRLVKGSKEPILGWYSDAFLNKIPTTTIYSKIEQKGSFTLKTIIEIEP